VRILRALLIALLTASAGCILAFFVGDYLTRLAHVPEMEGQRGMAVFFVCVPLGLLAGFLIGIVSSVVVRRRGIAGFIIAQAWSLLIVCGLASLAGGIPYLVSDKPPRIDGKQLELQFEWRAPAKFEIPDQPDGYSVRVNLYIDGRQDRYAFIELNSIMKNAEHSTIQGHLPLLTHSKTRSLLASIGNEPAASQFIELKNLPAAPGKEDETWSDWVFATEHADLTSVPDSERFAIRYRVEPIDR
jgi:hypothetical protein